MSAAKSDAGLVMEVSLLLARRYANQGRFDSFSYGLHAGRVQAAAFMTRDPDDVLMAESVANELNFLRLYQTRHFPLSGF